MMRVEAYAVPGLSVRPRDPAPIARGDRALRGIGLRGWPLALWWTSRQARRRDAVMLFGRRCGRSGGIARGELEVVVPSLPFLAPKGYELLCEVATRLDITVLFD